MILLLFFWPLFFFSLLFLIVNSSPFLFTPLPIPGVEIIRSHWGSGDLHSLPPTSPSVSLRALIARSFTHPLCAVAFCRRASLPLDSS